MIYEYKSHMCEIEENKPLAPLSYYKVGGIARYYVAPKSVEELQSAVIWAEKQQLPHYVFGNSSNLVFSDKGYPGLVIHTEPHFNQLKWNGNILIGQSGALIYKCVKQSVQKGFAGIQKLGGVPGTLGGAAYINAGAYGQEFSDVITKVVSCKLDGTLVERTGKECDFSYRHSLFCSLEEMILEVSLDLSSGVSQEQLRKEMKESLAHRKTHQPLNYPNAGSVFKRPAGQYPGAIIEEAGLKGLRCGGAEVSEKHANFIINTGGATAQDIYQLSEDVKCKVYEHSGIVLEKEVRFVGNFGDVFL
jgi:UDP-N-acetylmuramate dehydrogenase